MDEFRFDLGYSQEITHTVNTPFLLIEIRMNIQIKCRCYIRVTKYDADSFIITLAFNASGCKCMPEPVKNQVGNIQSFQQPAKIVTVRAWLFRLYGSTYHVKGL